VVPPIFLSPFDVAVLRALVSAAEQDDDGIPHSAEIHPVTGSEVDAKLLHAITHGADVAKVAQPNAGDALADTVAVCSIPKALGATP